jgi:hypothetical protein
MVFQRGASSHVQPTLTIIETAVFETEIPFRLGLAHFRFRPKTTGTLLYHLFITDRLRLLRITILSISISIIIVTFLK